MADEVRERMVVILGAGASYDCVPSTIDRSTLIDSKALVPISALPLDEVRPPLTQHLAESRTLTNWAAARWQWARPVVSHLRGVLRTAPGHDDYRTVLSLEEALRSFEGRSESISDRRRQMLAMRFYLRDLFKVCTDYMYSPELTGGVTNHVQLLNAVLEWCGNGRRREAAVISFNYDLILERAVASVIIFDPLNFDHYLHHPRLKVLKPHGSIIWHYAVAPTTVQTSHGSPVALGEQCINTVVSNFGFSVEDLVATEVPVSDEVIEQKHQLLPALAIPTTGKTEFVWPAEQRNYLVSLRGDVTRLLTIGWRGLEPDFLPLLKPLVRPDGRVLVVCGGDRGEAEAEETVSRLQKTLTTVGPRRWSKYGGGFAEFIEGRSGEYGDFFLR